MLSEVSYLGHQIDAEGLHPLPSKVQAVVDAPTPSSVQELKAYLGLLTQYGKFLPDLPSVLAPFIACSRRVDSGAGKGKKRELFGNQRSF